MHLNHHPFLAGVLITDFGYPIAWATDFEEHLPLYAALGRCDHELSFFGIAGGTTGKVRLMLFTLGVGQVGAFICMERQAKTTFQRAQVVA